MPQDPISDTAGLPKLIRMYILNVLIGFGISAVFVAGLILFDVGGLRNLLTGSSAGIMAIALMWFANGIVFAGVQFAIAVMRLREDDRPGGGTRAPITRLVSLFPAEPKPIPVLAKAPKPNGAPNKSGCRPR